MVPLLGEFLSEGDAWERAERSSYGAKEKCVYGYVGIRNLGSICYMNSMLQQMFIIPPFRKGVLSVNDEQAPNIDNPHKIDDNILHQLQKLFGFLSLSNRCDYNPFPLCFSFKDIDGKPTNTAIQQDAQEFLNLAFDRFENLFKGTAYKYLTQSVFGGDTCTRTLCRKCGKVKKNYEPFYTLSLDVKNNKTLSDSLTKFVSDDIVDEYFCEQCQQKVQVCRNTFLHQLPNVLIVHLKRFAYNYDTFLNEKVYNIYIYIIYIDKWEIGISEINKRERIYRRRSESIIA